MGNEKRDTERMELTSLNSHKNEDKAGGEIGHDDTVSQVDSCR